MRLDAKDTDFSTQAIDIVINYYNEPHRAYHNLDHLIEVLQWLDWYKEGKTSQDYDIIELALFYHDVIYDGARKDSEERSAMLLAEHGLSLGLDLQVIEKAQKLVIMTKDHLTAKSNLEVIMADCDLAILGAEPARFQKYDDDIRKEYHFVPEEIWQEKRPSVMARFQAEARIYKTERFYDRLEEQARENLAIFAPAPKRYNQLNN
jgi:predicted metal-dependent HD superfamily phosphohydrolase